MLIFPSSSNKRISSNPISSKLVKSIFLAPMWVFLGGGGGGGGFQNSPAAAGGSGVVILKYTFGDATNQTFVFANTGQFVVPDGITTIDYLLVAGGGGGSLGTSGGGGGAGGFLTGTGYPVGPNQLYTIQIGAGGTAGIIATNYLGLGKNGGNTVFNNSTTSYGGGAGGGWSNSAIAPSDPNGFSGASGGGRCKPYSGYVV